MGLSRNKVAVPEGAAGTPPFWSVSTKRKRSQHSQECVDEAQAESTYAKSRVSIEERLSGRHDDCNGTVVFMVSLLPCLSCTLLESVLGGLAQLARALAWHARGHRFDPDILHFTLL